MDYINTELFYNFCSEVDEKLKIIYKGVDGKPLSKDDVETLKKCVLEKIGQFSCKKIEKVEIENEDVLRSFNDVFALCSHIFNLCLIIRSCRDAMIGSLTNQKFAGLKEKYAQIVKENKNEIELLLPQLKCKIETVLEARGTTRNRTGQDNQSN